MSQLERRESAEISQLLSIGFLADRLLLALDAHAITQLSTEEPELLDRFQQMLDGIVQLGEEPTAILSRQTSGFAFPGAEYVALDLVWEEIDPDKLKTVLTMFRRLQHTVQTIRKGNAPPQGDLDELRSLLERLAESSLDEVDNRRMRLESGISDRKRLTAEWQKISTP
jgi:hypothetical protein